MSIGRYTFCILSVSLLLSGCSQFFNKTDNAKAVDNGEFSTPVAETEGEKRGGLVLDNKSVDFGIVEMNDILSRRMKVKNESDRAVRITEVKSSCGCTQCTAGSDIVEPGATASIEIMLDTHGLIGGQYHIVTILTESDKYEFPVMAEIKQ